MADFSHIQSIETVVDNCDDSKASLQLKVAGSKELLTVTCPSITEAENLADLIDGYCRLVNNSTTSIWNRKGKRRLHGWDPVVTNLFAATLFLTIANTGKKRGEGWLLSLRNSVTLIHYIMKLTFFFSAFLLTPATEPSSMIDSSNYVIARNFQFCFEGTKSLFLLCMRYKLKLK